MRRRGKQILDAFNARREALKLKLESKPPLPLAHARKNQRILVQDKITSTMNSSSDDGFRNYEENKTKMEALARMDSETDKANRELNIEAVVRSQ